MLLWNDDFQTVFWIALLLASHVANPRRGFHILGRRHCLRGGAVRYAPSEMTAEKIRCGFQRQRRDAMRHARFPLISKMCIQPCILQRLL